MNTTYQFYKLFVWHTFDIWYDCVLSKYEGRQIDRDTFLAAIGGGEL